jgi:outer membrane protein OmpA-like peptidoglycan-associated protein
MAQDWAADVKKYVPNADDAVIKGIVRYCGIALQKVDSSLVSFSDPTELARVRNNFLKKKCGLTHSDEVLDGHIAAVGDIMKADRTKNRVTVYYLLVDKLGLQHLFVKGAVAGAAVAAPVAAAAAAAVVAAPKPVAAPVAAPAPVPAPVPAPASTAAPVALAGGLAAAGAGAAAASARTHGDMGGKLVRHVPGNDKGGLGWLLWLLAGLALLAALWYLFMRPAAPVDVATPAATTTADTSMTVPAEPAAAPQAAPKGAGLIAEERDAKPLVKVYFDTGKADVVPEFAEKAATMKAYLDGHPGSIIGVSGYNDPRGNAAVNAALSKKRAQAVQAALIAAGVPEASIELIKPEAATDATTSLDEARRVEVYIKS